MAADVWEHARNSRVWPEQHQRDADAAVLHECRGEEFGRECGDDAVAKGGRDTQANQGPYVGAAVDDGLRPSGKERPTGPEDHRGAQHQFNPVLIGDRRGRSGAPPSPLS